MTIAAALGKRRARALIAAAAVLLVVAAAGLALRLGHPARDRHAARPSRPVARSAMPLIPPVLLTPTIRTDLTLDEARASNAAVPVAPGRVPAARPFIYAGTPIDRAAAATCLAAAVLYEAGDDKPGEQAVAQAVLNRVRHPAFPKTVCGVVFEGSARKTGCQFTFTCDGSLARALNPQAWMRARAIAEAALAGAVFKGVGTATHYHTDWVVPYWRDSLEKVAQIHTQVFYRFPGRWGRAGAFMAGLQPNERLDARILALAGPQPGGPGLLAPDEAATAEAPPPPLASLRIEGVPASALKGSVVRLMDTDANQYVLQLDPAAFPGSWAIAGYTICGPKPDCLVMGWTSATEIPRAFPVLPIANRSMAFMYRKNSALGIIKPYWDCRRFARADTSQCLAGTRP